jgi:hypothetical protein
LYEERVNHLRASLFYEEYEMSRFDSDFESYSFGGYTKLSPIIWSQDREDIAVFAGYGITRRNVSKSRSRTKVAIVLEPISLTPSINRAVRTLHEYFDVVLTYDDSLLRLGKPFFPYVPGGTLLMPQDKIRVGPKRKLVSVVASEKRQLAGHQLRHDIVRELASQFNLDVMGRGYSKYSIADEPFYEHYFSIAVENSMGHHNITEKLIQPFLNKCVPLYWGGAAASEIFDPEGFIRFSNLENLRTLLEALTPQDYFRRLRAVERNFEIAQNLMSKEVNILQALSKSGVISAAAALSEPPRLTEGQPVEPSREVTFNKPTSRTRVKSALARLGHVISFPGFANRKN